MLTYNAQTALNRSLYHFQLDLMQNWSFVISFLGFQFYHHITIHFIIWIFVLCDITLRIWHVYHAKWTSNIWTSKRLLFQTWVKVPYSTAANCKNVYCNRLNWPWCKNNHFIPFFTQLFFFCMYECVCKANTINWMPFQNVMIPATIQSTDIHNPSFLQDNLTS